MPLLRLVTAAFVASLVLCGCERDDMRGSVRANPVSSTPMALTRGGTEVVIAPDAPMSIRYTAAEATNLLSRILGAAVPIVNAPTDARASLFLGDSEWTRKAGIDVLRLPRDAFEMRVFSEGIALAGRDGKEPDPYFVSINANETPWQPKNERATLFALYEFLERYAGARFYFPGELGTILPQAEEIVVTDGHFASTPDFTVRRYGYGDGVVPKELLDEYGGDWVAFKRANFLRLRMETTYIPCCHGLNKFRYLARFGKTHPEYFALRSSGKRDTTGGGLNGQLCFSSPITDVIYEDVKAYLTGADPKTRGLPKWGANVFGDVVDVMAQDGMFACTCPDCKKRYDFSKKANYATEFIWSNTVSIATRLAAEGIPCRLTQMAYTPYGAPPETVTIPSNVLVMVATFGPWSLATPKMLELSDSKLKAWTEKLGHKVWQWNYPCKVACCNTRYAGIPQVSPRAWGEYYKHVAPYVFGAFAESESDRWIYNYLNYYVFSRVCWDNSADVDAILDEHFRLMFGPAAPEMDAFFRALEESWTKNVAGRTRESSIGPVVEPPFDEELYGKVYGPEALARYNELFDRGLAKVATDSLEARRMRLFRREMLEPLEKLVEEFQKRRKALETFVHPAKKDVSSPIALRHLSAGRQVKPAIPDLATKVYVWREGKELRIVYDCAEPEMAKRAVGKGESEQAVVNDDGVEFYFCAKDNRRRCYNFWVNSEGKCADAVFIKVGSSVNMSKDYSYKSGMTAKVVKRSDGWKAAITIPIESLKYINVYSGMLGANFCRNRSVSDGKNGSVDFYVWGPYVKGYPDVQNFGVVDFTVE